MGSGAGDLLLVGRHKGRLEDKSCMRSRPVLAPDRARWGDGWAGTVPHLRNTLGSLSWLQSHQAQAIQNQPKHTQSGIGFEKRLQLKSFLWYLRFFSVTR